MTAERYRRINELADAALEMPVSSRSVWLDEVCARDPELRHEVERLVDAHGSSGGFLERPAVERLASELAVARESVSLAGREIGKYRVLTRLGAGGHGEVWLAEDTRLLRKAAIKVLSADIGARAFFIEQLYTEARICSALNHPNIVTIYDTGETEGEAFLAQECVEGETLRKMLTRGPLPEKTAAAMAEQVAAALEAAHAAGVVHRDIKPENIMVRPDGLVKVLDFGLARYVEGDDQGALTGILAGTVKYMSPEQTRGLLLDARTDIFSAGVVLYEMLKARRLSPPLRPPTPWLRFANIHPICAASQGGSNRWSENAWLRTARNAMPMPPRCATIWSLPPVPSAAFYPPQLC